MIVDPITIEPDQKVSDALELMSKYSISGVPVTKKGKLVGILTNRDLRFEENLSQPVSNVMTKKIWSLFLRIFPLRNRKSYCISTE